METDQKCWYVAIVKKATEEKTRKNLEAKRFAVYLPLNRQVRKDGSNSYAPLLPQHLFVYLKKTEIEPLLVQHTVQGLLHYGPQPCAVDEQTIEMIRLFTQHYHNIHVERIPVDLSAQPHLDQSPMHGITGTSMSRQYALVRLYLPNLGALLVAEGLSPEIVINVGKEQTMQSSQNSYSNG